MKKKNNRIPKAGVVLVLLGTVMSFAEIVFLAYAVMHPDASISIDWVRKIPPEVLYVGWLLIAGLCNTAGAILLLIKMGKSKLIMGASVLLLLAAIASFVFSYALWHLIKATNKGYELILPVLYLIIPLLLLVGIILLTIEWIKKKSKRKAD